MSAQKLQQLARKCDLALKPLDAWPGARTADPKPSQFRAEWVDTCWRLSHELDELSATDRVLQLDAPAEQFRLDGMPRAGIRLGRGVVLSLTTDAGPLMFPCDAYDAARWYGGMPGWEANIRALTLGLEALRAVDRYGISPRHEQYRGWAALPAATPEGFASVEAAACFLTKYSGFTWSYIAAGRSNGEAAYREAAKRLHPDAGGDTREFQRLQQAMTMLRKHWGAGA
jgi:hypothetical protein